MYPHNLSHVQMHLLRTAMVNADFLAFICMEWSAMQESTKLITPANKNAPIFEKTEKIEMPLWKFMRHASPKLGFVQAETVKRHSKLRGAIKEAIEHGTHYPWYVKSSHHAQQCAKKARSLERTQISAMSLPCSLHIRYIHTGNPLLVCYAH